MTNVPSMLNRQEDAFWWQGSLYRIKARAENTGGALGVVEASFYRGFGPPLPEPLSSHLVPSHDVYY